MWSFPLTFAHDGLWEFNGRLAMAHKTIGVRDVGPNGVCAQRLRFYALVWAETDIQRLVSLRVTNA